MIRILDKQRIELSTTIQQDYEILFNAQLKEFSTEFATAYEAKEKRNQNPEMQYYVLLYNRDFPVDLDKLNILREIGDNSIQKLIDIGKVKDVKGAEHLSAVFRKPKGRPVDEILRKKGRLDETLATGIILNQLSSAISILHINGIMHGRISPDKIYYDELSGSVTLLEATSEYIGYSQSVVYETFERMVCHPASKSHREPEADYYALGACLNTMIFGDDGFSGIPDNLILRIKFEAGSFDSLHAMTKSRVNILINAKTEILIRGLLHDKTSERWGNKEIQAWKKRQIGQSSPSRIHRHANTAFHYDDMQYFSTKYLAHAICENWSSAKKNLKIPDLSRWLSTSSKFADAEKKLFMMTRGGLSEVILPDDKIARIIYLLDDNGPIRYRKASFHPDGLGNLLCFLKKSNDEELKKDVFEAIDTGFIEGWISHQEDAEKFKSVNLGYNPRRIKFFLRKNEMGFGIERCIYETNPYLTCQSELLKNYFVLGLAQTLSVIERIKFPPIEDTFDKEIMAYICFHAGVDDSIKVKQLQNLPFFSKSFKLKICAIFALAQKMSGLISLPNTAEWLRQSCIDVLDRIYSSKLREKIKENVDKNVESGDINALFSSIADAKTITKDILGFREAKKQFKILSFQKLRLKSQKSLDNIAMHMGLRISVAFSYLICSVVFVVITILKTH